MISKIWDFILYLIYGGKTKAERELIKEQRELEKKHKEYEKKIKEIEDETRPLDDNVDYFNK